MAPLQYDTNNAAENGPSSSSINDHISVDLDINSSGMPLTSATETSDFYIDLQSPPPQTQSMRLRLRKQASNNSILSAEASEKLRRRVARVKKNKHPKEVRVFKQRLQLAVRIAVGVLLAGVIQTKGSDREWLFLPASYYLGGLTVASMMVIYAAANTVGGVLEQVWQIDVGVAIALLYNFVVFACVPITQGDLMTVSKNINGSTYYVSLQDWGVTLPLLALFTLVVLLSPIQTNVKKFAVSTNLYFTLTLVDPMNPVFTTILKDNSKGNSYYGTDNLLKQLAIYSAVGVVGTLIALATMVLPYPIFAMRKLRRHMAASPHDIRDILNLIVDSYCFRAKDIKKMDFFKLRLDRLLDNAHERLTTMESLLSDCWWEELVGFGVCFHFNKTVAKQLVKLYAKLLADLHAMKFAIEAETCHWTHVVLLQKMQTRFYVLQVEANDLLEDISLKIVHSSRTMSSSKFASLEKALERLMAKYTTLYGNLLSADVHTADDVGKTMPLNVFVYSFHVFVVSLLEFEGKFNRKNFSARYRVKNFVKLACRSLLQPINYPRRLIIFAFRTTLAIIIGICCATFIFGFSSTAPTAIAMVAEDNIGGTYGNTVNRVGGLVAGTVVPSIFSFFVCKVADDNIYNTLNNIVLFVWTVGSMYVWFCGRYMALAGMTSAFMAASVLLDHSCRSSSASTTVSYASLTQNALGILILMVVEIIKWDQSMAVVEAGVEGAFDTLVTLFGEEFSGSTAEDHAIYLQMKEAFRIADVHRRGVVDASELSLLLEKLMPYSGSQGIGGMEQYVDKFMQLVDKDRDGKISFNEFMQALNEGFRLELEIYDDQPQVPVNDVITGSNGSQLTPSKNSRLLCMSSASESSAPEALLNVEAFTLTEAAIALKHSYGECLLGYVDDHNKRITMEDFIVMSCVISACENIAENLTRLNTLAAS
ncbi:hypothetical protein JG688_00006309 [Phytophthora aleatoria]|uniref:EF-hand domain-containing protein n=1 Tax=Phytophthora aleatoria TaxID=2496075 RepID=A0A8J5IZR0_9STRA|nr:hypothetical protein JG688_00006309 [Phytophthora aleatoria]